MYHQLFSISTALTRDKLVSTSSIYQHIGKLISRAEHDSRWALLASQCGLTNIAWENMKPQHLLKQDDLHSRLCPVSETHGKQVVQVWALNQSLWALVKANVGHPTLPLAEEVWFSLGKICFRVNRKKSTRNHLYLLQTPRHGFHLTPRQGGVISIGFKTAQTQIWPLN